jgi:hypothetical protein
MDREEERRKKMRREGQGVGEKLEAEKRTGRKGKGQR